MKKFVMSALMVMGMAAAKDSHAQGGIMKIDNFVPMVNFGWTAGEGAKDKQGRVDLMSNLVTNRAMVLQYKQKGDKKSKVVSDTLVFEPITPTDTIPADGELMFGFNDSGSDVQAMYRSKNDKGDQTKTVFFMNSAAQMGGGAQMPFRLAHYDAKKHGKIGTWMFND